MIEVDPGDPQFFHDDDLVPVILDGIDELAEDGFLAIATVVGGRLGIEARPLVLDRLHLGGARQVISMKTDEGIGPTPGDAVFRLIPLLEFLIVRRRRGVLARLKRMIGVSGANFRTLFAMGMPPVKASVSSSFVGQAFRRFVGQL